MPWGKIQAVESPDDVSVNSEDGKTSLRIRIVFSAGVKYVEEFRA